MCPRGAPGRQRCRALGGKPVPSRSPGVYVDADGVVDPTADRTRNFCDKQREWKRVLSLGTTLTVSERSSENTKWALPHARHHQERHSDRPDPGHPPRHDLQPRQADQPRDQQARSHSSEARQCSLAVQGSLASPGLRERGPHGCRHG